jgi:hypothetical protein
MRYVLSLNQVPDRTTRKSPALSSHPRE